MKGMVFVSALACLTATAQAGDVTYDLSGGQIASISATGSLADGTFAARFPFPAAFTVETSTLKGSAFEGVGTFSAAFAPSTAADQRLFGQGFQDTEQGYARFTVNESGAKPEITSFEAGVPTQYPSGDIKGFVWGFDYLKTATGSVLTISEQYLSYLGTEFGTATETIRNVDLSVVNPMQAPEIDPASGASAVTLLLAGVTVLQSRRKR